MAFLGQLVRSNRVLTLGRNVETRTCRTGDKDGCWLVSRNVKGDRRPPPAPFAAASAKHRFFWYITKILVANHSHRYSTLPEPAGNKYPTANEERLGSIKIGGSGWELLEHIVDQMQNSYPGVTLLPHYRTRVRYSSKDGRAPTGKGRSEKRFVRPSYPTPCRGCI